MQAQRVGSTSLADTDPAALKELRVHLRREVARPTPVCLTPSSCLISRSALSGGAPTCEEAIDNEDDNCADHADHEASPLAIPTDGLPKVTCNERAYDFQDCR